ncbi:serine/threonine-protein kinase [Synechococcus sp. PCC 7336]|uniref:serine/threonine-protein kinase n=1 Tax=Synechococcus sp. PCC 7336 TaxID=195250 RepID=UPI0003630579|nr:serine/threonine-protein kinase [Synechococcus sp. PCC 7336]
MTEIGQRLQSRYLITDMLSGGGFSVTFLARDTHLPDSPICVVKQLKILSNDPQYVENARKFFFNEAKTLRQLGKTHNQIPELLAYFTDDDRENFYIVQEFIPGKTLRRMLGSGTILSEPEVLYILKQTLEILEFVHSYNVIHLDIKPDNLILRDSDHKIVLIDFGSVKQVRTQFTTSTNLTPQTTTLGTPGYMPCEQSYGRPKLSSDFYALGMVAIQALTGIHPKELHEDSTSGEIIWQERAAIESEFKELLGKMVRYHFGQRHQSAAEILQEIAKLESLYPDNLDTCPERLQALVADRQPPPQPLATPDRTADSDSATVENNPLTLMASERDEPMELGSIEAIPTPPYPQSFPAQQKLAPLRAAVGFARQTSLAIWHQSKDRAPAAVRSVRNAYATSTDRLRSLLDKSEVKASIAIASFTAILLAVGASWFAVRYIGQLPIVSRDREILLESRQLAEVNLEDAIQKAREIPPESPLHSRAVTQIESYRQALLSQQQLERDRDLLARARTLSPTDLEAAITTVAQIDSDSPLSDEARLDSWKWQSNLLETHLANSSPTLAALSPQIEIRSEGLLLQYDDSSDAKLASEEGIRRVAIAMMAALRSKYTEFDRLIIYPAENDLQGRVDTSLWISYKNGDLTLDELLDRIPVVDRVSSVTDRVAVAQQF